MTTPGSVVSDLIVTGTVEVKAANVTLRRIRVVPAATTDFGIHQQWTATNLTVEDSEIITDGRHAVQYGLRQEASGLTVRRTVVRGVGQGLAVTDHVTVPAEGNAAIAILANDEATSAVTVADNLLAGGAYALHLGDGLQNVTVTGNRFSRAIAPAGGTAGPVRWDHPAPGVTWSANVWADTGAQIPPP